jgi:peroxiredoxin
LGELNELGASLVAMTPQKPEHNRTLRDKHALNYHMLTDPGNDYAAELGLRFTVPEQLQEVYRGLKIDLPFYNGEDSWTLPVPARLVIDTGGIVRAADIDADYTKRPEADKTLSDLQALI